ncbi:hypothetical protein [Dendronalium sp. ChiSLP03b]|uniref:hypothetical protein n=1 Tax=Dendronalium sp. ChiSLP03b TaxID=3075381 RepID=UPI002AD29C12|nr:hypothetical protein [Dendronalium sp. ChiSLP03b]MDZ8205395.1 hypothetical protein [Dendronalium sp. ChiSLP03b]
MNPNESPDPEKLNKLLVQIDGFKDWYWHLHIRNLWISNAMITFGIFLGLSVTATGFLGYGVASGIFGLIITLFISLQNAFNFAEKAEFYRVIHAEAKILRDRLRYKVHSSTDFDAIVDSLIILRRQAEKDIPKGKGMEVVKDIYVKLPPEIHKP